MMTKRKRPRMRQNVRSLDVVNYRRVLGVVVLGLIFVVVLLFVGGVHSLGSYSNYRIVKKRPFSLISSVSPSPSAPVSLAGVAFLRVPVSLGRLLLLPRLLI